ncbi:MAG TPA: NUDIX domain-containing protein [Burkholderiaceae bacterium]
MLGKPAPVSVGIIPAAAKGHVLFIERTDGGIALPGGYVDALENAAQAVTRESFEEMGLHLDVAKWHLFDSHITDTNKLILFSYYHAHVAEPLNFTPNDEVVRVISAPWNTPLVFDQHELALQKWAALHAIEPLSLRPSRATRLMCAETSLAGTTLFANTPSAA